MQKSTRSSSACLCRRPTESRASARRAVSPNSAARSIVSRRAPWRHHQRRRMLEVAGRCWSTCSERAPPEGALGRVAARMKAISTGSVILPSRKSSPTVLPSRACSAPVVERVVDQLEGDAEVLAVGRQRVLVGLAAGRPPRRRPGRRRGTGRPSWRRSSRDRLLRCVPVSLAVISCATSPSAITADALARIARTRSEPSATISWKARENRKSPTSTGALLPHTALAVLMPRRSVALVDDVVVQQRRRMNELDRGGEADMALAAIAAHAGRQQRQDRPHALAAGLRQVLGQLRDQRHLALHALDDQTVDLA